MMSVGTNILSWSELQTCMFEIANLLNGRPIGLKPGFDPSLGIYLCPNDLLLGRTGVSPQWIMGRKKQSKTKF